MIVGSFTIKKLNLLMPNSVAHNVWPINNTQFSMNICCRKFVAIILYSIQLLGFPNVSTRNFIFCTVIWQCSTSPFVVANVLIHYIHLYIDSVYMLPIILFMLHTSEVMLETPL